MSCRTYQTRHVPSRSVFPRFDKYFVGNEGFIRPLRLGQETPTIPEDLVPENKSYLIQGVDGKWLASLSCDSLEDVIMHIESHKGVPLLMH
jgi:hypothetical protein